MLAVLDAALAATVFAIATVTAPATTDVIVPELTTCASAPAGRTVGGACVCVYACIV